MCVVWLPSSESVWILKDFKRTAIELYACLPSVIICNDNVVGIESKVKWSHDELKSSSCDLNQHCTIIQRGVGSK